MTNNEKVSALLLSFLLSLFGFISVLCLIVNLSVLNPSFMIKALKEKNYYDAVFIEYCDEVEHLSTPAGVGEGVFQSVISKSKFVTDVDNVIVASYKNDGSYAGDVIGRDDVYNRFYNTIIEYAAKKDISITDELEVGIANVAEICTNTYEIYVTIPFIDTIGSYSNELAIYFKVGAVIGITAFILLILLMCSDRKKRRISAYLSSIALISDGLMMIILPLIILISGKQKYINIEIRSMYLFAVGYIEKILSYFIVGGVIAVILGIVITVLYEKLKKKLY